MSLYYSNLRVKSIQNKSSVPYENLLCCVCLEIAMNPNECSNCELLICQVCPAPAKTLPLVNKNKYTFQTYTASFLLNLTSLSGIYWEKGPRQRCFCVAIKMTHWWQ